MGAKITPLSQMNSQKTLDHTRKADRNVEPLLEKRKLQPSSTLTPLPKKKDENSIRLLFEAMLVAKVLQRNGLDQTKKINRLIDERWDTTAIKIQKQHEKTANSQKNVSVCFFAIPVIQISGMIAAQFLHSNWYLIPPTPGQQGPSDLSPWGKSKLAQAKAFSDFFAFFPLLQNVTQLVPNTASFVLNTEDLPKKVGELSSSFATTTISAVLQNQVEQIRTDNEAKQAPLGVQSQAYASKSQNNGSDESAEKQQLAETDRLLKELMQQDERLYQGAIGRG